MKKILFMAVIALLATMTASAQDKGKWAVGPKLGFYTNTGFNGMVVGIGAIGRYSFTDTWRVEPAIAALIQKGCSVDINADVHYLFKVASDWNVYPLAGISANDIGGWSAGINLGAGADFSVTPNWDLTASAKWMIQTAKGHKNPIIISLGAAYKF